MINKTDLGFGGGSKSNNLKLNVIKLDAEEGVFNYMKFLDPKNEDGSYPSVRIPDKTITGVILAVRRKLQVWVDADKKTYATNEFNSNTEEITYYGATGAEKGTAENLRKKYPTLKTLAVIYFYSPRKDEMVRLNCKGLGLQPEDNKGTNVKGLFQYLGSFDKEESPSDFLTTVLFVPKEITKGRKTKTYQAMRFERGEALDEATKAKVETFQEQVLAQFSGEKTETEPSKIDNFVADTIEYPEEEINVEDIPF